MRQAAEVQGFRSIAGFTLGLLAVMLALNVNVERGSAGAVPIPIGPPPAHAPEPEPVTVEAGTMPLILSVPHGGNLRPASIPDRQGEIVVNDPLSLEFGRELAAEIQSISGNQPHLVVNNLHRIKMDPNRPLAAGAQGNVEAVAAWEAYHLAIESASAATVGQCGWGLYLEIHTHGASGRWTELGYGLTVDDLDRPDEELAGRLYASRANIRSLALNSDVSLPDLVRGEGSLGGKLEAAGYRVAPSPRHPVPDKDYFDGGYGVYRHGSRFEGALDAIQLEAPYDLMDSARRPAYVRALARSIVEFLRDTYGVGRPGPGGVLCSPYVDVPIDSPHFDEIMAVHELGGLDACSESPRRFCPGKTVSRGEAGALLWLALNPDRERPVATSEFFQDVDGEGSQMLDELWLKGYLASCPSHELSYCPDLPSTDLDLAMMILKAVRGAEYVPPRPTPIVAGTAWDMWWLSDAEAQGYLPSCLENQGFTCSQRPASRADWAQALALARDEINRR